MPGLSPSTPRVFPLVLGTRDRNVTFIVDISEGMYPALGSVKQWLVQTLLTKASLRDSLFNILGFSYKVTKWSEHMVTCSPDTVYEAMRWIHSLSCSPGGDLMGALAAAFSDPACQSVHLMTNALPDDPEGLFRFLPTMVGVRPVHVMYLSDTCCPDSTMQTFLHRLAQATRGSCHILSLSSTGAVEKVRPLYLAESRSSPPACSDLKYCSAGAVLSRPLSCSCASLFMSPYRCSLGHLGGAYPVSICSRAWGGYTGPPNFATGSRVLARRELDRFYYLGTVREELQGRRGVYLVEFDSRAVEGGSCETVLQLTSPLDLVHHTQAHGHSLVPGDKVLAPWEASLARYGPGSVIQGVEMRDPLRGEDSGRNESGLQVLFWNGCQVRVPGEVAVWIPTSLHERILQELQRPLCFHGDARSCLPWPRYNLCPGLPCHAPPPPTPLVLPHHCPHEDWWRLSAMPPYANELTGTTLKSGREELERKVDAQLKELGGLGGAGSQSSSDVGDEVDEETKPAGVDVASAAVNTDVSLLEKPKSDPLGRPAWRYWGRSSSEAQHRQPERLMKNTSGSAKTLPPEAQIDSPTNHSSLFQLLPVTTGQRLTVKDVLRHRDSASPSIGTVQFQLSVTGKSIPATHT